MRSFSWSSSTLDDKPREDRRKTFRDVYALIETDYINNQRSSIRNVRGAWKAHLEKAFGDQALADYDPALVQAYIRARLESGAKPATVNRELAPLKRIASLAQQMLSTSDDKLLVALYRWAHIKGLREQNVRQGFLKDSEYDALAHSTAKQGIWLRGMFECACTYGWRKSELVNLQVFQVDLEDRTISLAPTDTKNGEARIVEMTKAVFDLLSVSVASKRPEDRVFTRPASRRHPGRERAIADFRKAWERATEEAKVPDLLFHDLRRTGVRNLRRRGIPERVIMQIVGHKTKSMLDRYNIVDREDLKDAVRKIEEWHKERARQAELEKQEKLLFGDADPEKKPN